MRQLQTAQITWVQDEDDNNWVVRDAEGEELFQLPGRLTDKEAMAILHAARDAENTAYEYGKDNGMQAMKCAMHGQVTNLQAQLTVVREMNERLASQLEEHLNRDE